MLRLAGDHRESCSIYTISLHVCNIITKVIFGLEVSDICRGRGGEVIHVLMANKVSN
jgi:hypothetical protein